MPKRYGNSRWQGRPPPKILLPAEQNTSRVGHLRSHSPTRSSASCSQSSANHTYESLNLPSSSPSDETNLGCDGVKPGRVYSTPGTILRLTAQIMPETTASCAPTSSSISCLSLPVHPNHYHPHLSQARLSWLGVVRPFRQKCTSSLHACVHAPLRPQLSMTGISHPGFRWGGWGRGRNILSWGGGAQLCLVCSPNT
jgi:hypothetical protein